MLSLRDEKAQPRSEPLLETVMRGGRRCAPRPWDAAAVQAVRRRFRTDLAALPQAVRAVHMGPTCRITLCDCEG